MLTTRLPLARLGRDSASLLAACVVGQAGQRDTSDGNAGQHLVLVDAGVADRERGHEQQDGDEGQDEGERSTPEAGAAVLGLGIGKRVWVGTRGHRTQMLASEAARRGGSKVRSSALRVVPEGTTHAGNGIAKDGLAAPE